MFDALGNRHRIMSREQSIDVFPPSLLVGGL